MTFLNQIIFVAICFIVSSESSAVDERSGAGETCPNGFVRLDKGCYYFSSEKVNVYKARMTCRSLKADLIAIETQQEFSAIKSYIQKNLNDRSSWWTSGSDEMIEGQWFWTSTGQEIKWAQWCTLTDESCCNYLALTTINWCLNDFIGKVTEFRYICEL